MKLSKISLLSLFIVCIMLVSMLAACDPADGTEGTTEQQATETVSEKETDPEESSGALIDPIETDTDRETDSQTDKGPETETETETEKDTSPKLEGEYAALIENAHDLKNGVTSYFTDAGRNHYRIENGNMNLDLTLTPEEDMLTTVTNKKGAAYVKDTMDVFIKMTSGKTYYSSGSQSAATANLFRYGYYYYDAHFYNQNFINETTVTAEEPIKLSKIDKAHSMSDPKVTNKGLKTIIENSEDPYICGSDLSIATNRFNAIRITLKVTSTSTVNVFFVAGSHTNFSEDQRIDFIPIADGEFHTYIIPMDSAPTKDYTGTLSQLRFDFNGAVGELIEISELSAIKIETDGAPEILMDRNLHVYPDKMHQVIRLIATEDTTGIEEIGMITKVAANTVDKLIVKDKNGLHNSVDGVDWDSAEYIGFDIKNVGVFGYILPKDDVSGKISVTLDGSDYVITQTTTPKNGTILAPIPASSNKDTVVNAFKGQSNDPYHSVNEFDFGQRIYTDSNHTFDKFLYEAECERDPLTAENIKINTEKTPKGTFDGYDPLRGIYCFTVPESTGFGEAFYNHPNRHCEISFSITGDDRDRDIYVLAYAFTTSLECAAVLDKNDMMLPVPVEVSKNFSNEFEEPIFAWGDIRYGEARIPMVIKAGETQELTIVHLYQNWGNYPLKQISSIQFFAPYYHLSTGCTESNCISSYYVYGKDLQMLPDHRAMSAPMWAGDPQHTNGGNHSYLQYTDAEGNYYATENIVNILEAAGPTYSDIEMTYLSDDGKIKATYTHMEFPQLDENRAFYTMNYEVLDNISFKNFAMDFSFYSVRSIDGNYAKIGYLNENNESVVVDACDSTSEKLYKLGDEYPYFDMFYIPPEYPSGADYVNVSFLVRDASFIIGGEKVDPGFVIVSKGYKTRLSLDLEEVTLKKGDKFSITAIIMPWGSQISDYTTDAPDINVRNVRQDSIIDPLKATAGQNAEIIDSVWLPKIKTTNGKNAEFTLSGGENNVAFRVYGFKLLTVPKLYEKVDGEWKLIDVSSLNYPDKQGYAYAYDGYTVHYDGDGTYSYSFITTLTGNEPRTFKVEASEKFAEWPAPEIVVKEPTDVYFNPEEIGAAASMSNITFEVSEGGDYIRMFGDGESGEKYFSLDVSGAKTTGQYAIIKYRIPTDNDTDADHFQIYTGTKSSSIIGVGDWLVARDIKRNGEWNVMVIDIAAFNLPEFTPDENGAYSAEYFRFDIFNSVMSKTAYVDVAYIALCETFEEAIEINKDMISIDLVEEETSSTKIYTASGKAEPTEADLFNLYFDPEILSKASISGVSKTENLTDDSGSFIRYWGDGESAESYSSIYSSGTKVSGKYFIVKYRIPTTNEEDVSNSYIEFFTSTVNETPKGYGSESDFANTLDNKCLVKDGKWHVIVLDVTSKASCTTFTPDENGKYVTKFIRFDVFNGQVISTTSYIDVAYVGVCEDPSAIIAAEEDKNVHITKIQ